MGNGNQFYAHTPGEAGVWHDLVGHLQRTAMRAQKNGAKFGAGELAQLAALWHDIGKFNPDFQRYLRDCEKAKREGSAPPGKSTPHAIYGAMLASDSLQALASIIYGHHAGLPNASKLKDAVKRPEVREKYENIFPVAREEVEGMELQDDIRSLFSDPPRDELQMETLQRMLFSAVVDADFLDTEKHFDPGIPNFRGSDIDPKQLWEVFQKDRNEFLSSAGEQTVVNEVREEVYRFCLEAAERPQGVYRLARPSGWARIGTSALPRYPPPARLPVAPDLRVGRGLEPRGRGARQDTPPSLRPTFGLGEDWNSKRAFNVILLTVSVSVCPT